MEQSSCSETNMFQATQEIPHVLWNPKVYHRILKNPPLVRCVFEYFVTLLIFNGEDLLPPRPTLKREDHPL
jgi:hypothetical protein